jgi:hypothetical protein
MLNYDLGFDQAPPTRLLALGLILAYWLGWIDNEKDLDDMPVNAWNRLCEAYIAGRALSLITAKTIVCLKVKITAKIHSRASKAVKSSTFKGSASTVTSGVSST